MTLEMGAMKRRDFRALVSVCEKELQKFGCLETEMVVHCPAAVVLGGCLHSWQTAPRTLISLDKCGASFGPSSL